LAAKGYTSPGVKPALATPITVAPEPALATAITVAPEPAPATTATVAPAVETTEATDTQAAEATETPAADAIEVAVTSAAKTTVTLAAEATMTPAAEPTVAKDYTKEYKDDKHHEKIMRLFETAGWRCVAAGYHASWCPGKDTVATRISGEAQKT
jgi:hypothetical protein